MNQAMRDIIAQYIREGREQDLYNCGCMGCQNRVNGVCACEQAGYSPNGVRRPCKCSCQLPERLEQRAAFRAEVEQIRRGLMNE